MQTGTILTILEEITRETSMFNFFLICHPVWLEKFFKGAFLHLALAMILFNKEELFKQFWQRVTQRIYNSLT